MVSFCVLLPSFYRIAACKKLEKDSKSAFKKSLVGFSSLRISTALWNLLKNKSVLSSPAFVGILQ